MFCLPKPSNIYEEIYFTSSILRNKLEKYAFLWFKKETFISNGKKTEALLKWILFSLLHFLFKIKLLRFSVHVKYITKNLLCSQCKSRKLFLVLQSISYIFGEFSRNYNENVTILLSVFSFPVQFVSCNIC